MRTSVSIAVTLCMLVVLAAATCPTPPTVQDANLADFFSGRWYELANAIDSRRTIESDLVCSTANYTLDASTGLVRILNEGRVGSVNGTYKRAHLKGKQVAPGKFEVFTIPEITSPLWLLQLYGEASNGYDAAVVYACIDPLGLLQYENMWVLSRTTSLPSNLSFDEIYAAAAKMGIDVDHLQMKPEVQGPDCDYQ